MISIQTPKKILEAITLDILSIPGTFMLKQNNAKYHLNYICPICSNHRKSFRDIDNSKKCYWETQWKNGNYEIPKNFGIMNWIKYYLGLKPILEKYK